MYSGHQPERATPRIDNNMRLSLASILLFWPFAIPAIKYANRVEPLLRQGDFAAAQNAAAESRRWSKLAIIAGTVAWLTCAACCIGVLAMLRI
jgi:hypothetical protein